jgi:hypothetical protein
MPKSTILEKKRKDEGQRLFLWTKGVGSLGEY